MTNGEIECGPNAVFTFKREGYNKFDFSFNDTFQSLSFIGTWKLFINNWKFGYNEYKRAFSKSLFLKELQKIIPSLKRDDIVSGRSGVRAMALDKNGKMIDDFKIVKIIIICMCLMPLHQLQLHVFQLVFKLWRNRKKFLN